MDRLIELGPEFWKAALETLYMTTFALVLGGILGLAIGLILYVSRPGGLVENHEDGSVSLLLRLSDVCDGTIVWSREFDALKRGDPTGTEVALVRDIMSAIAEPYGIIQARARARAAAAGLRRGP